MSPESILDYDQLVAAYHVNLDATLRGFQAAEGMLETWVPDEDPVRSLANLVEAAQLCGNDSVSVRVGNKTLDGHSLDLLKEKLASLGEVAVARENESVTFAIAKLQETASFCSVRPIYQRKLRARFANLRFQRALKAGENQVPQRAVEEQFSLAWVVQPDKHIITDAVFDGPARGPMLAALDCLCEILVGLPVQEARDHAVVRLEFSLRDPRQRHAISGIILPRNADPMFRLPAILVNRLFKDYQTSTGYREAMNFYDPGPRAAWAALSPTEREQRLAAVLAAQRPALGIQAEDVHIVECKFPYAMTLRFGDRLSIPAKRTLALAIERVVREQCDPRLEVFCEEKKDLSRFRRMIEKPNP
jgi:NifU-like protein involved in Fe-S cluster formation